MILSHDPSKTWGESLLCSLALAKRRHKQGYDAVKLAAACGIPGPEKGLPGGVANTASYQERIAEFIRQIRDPYHFKCGGFVVRASFSQGGATLEECLRGILR